MIQKILSLWVRPTVLPRNPGSLISPVNTNLGADQSELPVLYLFEFNSLSDRTALKIVCDKYDLPDPEKSLRISTLQLPSSTDILKKRRRRIFGRSAFVPSEYPGKLLEVLKDDADADCLVIPVSVFWGQEPERGDSFWKVYFSEHWEFAGHTRKLLITLVHGRHTLLRFSEPVPLQRFIREASGQADEQLPLARLERKFQRTLRLHFRRRRRATIGPDLSHRRMLIQHVLADPDVRSLTSEKHAQADQSTESLVNKASAYGNEIAADMSYRTVRLMHRVLQRLWTQLYDGVELSGLDRLDAVVEGREIVYVPCHRSHIDYLLLSYILYVNGYSLPHIAAGINLNLPVVGGILRRAGAFFLRRSFSGNKLYASVFNTYLKELIQRGHSIEYFIEGGRSRSGLLLPAKAGMLSMTVQAYIKEPLRPVVFVPVYFGYERLLEGRSFSNELAGGKKKKESLFGLLKAVKTLREEYGSVYVNFGQPLPLVNFLDREMEQWREYDVDSSQASKRGADIAGSSVVTAEVATSTDPSEIPEFKNAITTLGREILTNINGAASVTPVSLVATLLLASPGHASGRVELEQQLFSCQKLLTELYKNSCVVVPDTDPADWLGHAESLGFVILEESELGAVVRIRPKELLSLMYFRNNVLHLFVVPSLIACLFSGQRKAQCKDIHELVEKAWPVLSTEFFLPQKPGSGFISGCVSSMLELGLLEGDEQSIVHPTNHSHGSILMIRLASLLQPAIERSFLAAALLTRYPEGILKKEFEARFQVAATRFALTEARDRNELYSKASFGNLVQSLLITGDVQLEGNTLKATKSLLLSEREMRRVLPGATRSALLAASDLVVNQVA